MGSIKASLNKIPGWLVMLVIAGFLYFTGLHTQVIGQVQRIILATGIIKPKMPVIPKENASKTANGIDRPEETLKSFPVADYDFTLRTQEGELVDFKSLKGKVIFMNLWATWCPPCIAEMPDIQNLYGKAKSDKIAFVMISLDNDPQKAKKFITRKGYTFPVYTPEGNFPVIYNSGNVIPATFVISPDGHIVIQKDGMAQYDTREMRKFLNDLSNR